MFGSKQRSCLRIETFAWFHRTNPSELTSCRRVSTKSLRPAGLQPFGVVRWANPVPKTRAGVYAVALTSDPAAVGPGLTECPVSDTALDDWLEARAELRLDGKRPTRAELAERVKAFWLPDEVILYIGLSTRPLRRRVNEYYKTPLGARKPHAGGHFLKTLSNLEALFVHFAGSESPAGAEDAMIRDFCANVSEATRSTLADLDHTFPFANLEWPRGTRKRHGLTGTKAAA